jgi:cyclopropane fatty-acyl-phospholipid synthase-like methyltransferase
MAQYGWQVTGIDFAAPAVHRGRKKAKQAGVQVDLQVGDVTRTHHLRGPFDLILDIGCFHSLDKSERQVYVKNLTRLLAPGGNFLIYAMLNEDHEDDKPGIRPDDIQLLGRTLTLMDRTDGLDRGVRASTWLLYQFQEQV